MLEPGLRKSVTHLRSFAAIPEAIHGEKAIEIEFDFFAIPKALTGKDKVEAIEVERATVEARPGDRHAARPTAFPPDLVVSCIGYRTSPIPDVPFDERQGRFANDEGRILPGLYCVGWARRGPSGTIGTNRPDGFDVVEKIGEDIAARRARPANKAGRPGFDALAEGARLWRWSPSATGRRSRRPRNRRRAKALRARNSSISKR